MKNIDTSRKILFGIVLIFSIASTGKAGGEEYLSIERASDTPLARNDLIGGIDITSSHPLGSVFLDSIEYVYAVIRDRYGNFLKLADSIAIWTCFTPETASITTGAFNDVSAVGVLKKVPGVSYGNALIAVSGPNMISDTVEVRISDAPNDYFIRLVDAAHPDKALDTVKLTTDQRITVIVQVRSARNPQWIEVTGYWSLGQGTLSTTTPVPSTPASLWVIDPIDTGSAVLTVVCGQAMARVPIIVYKDSSAIRLTLSMLTNPDSCFAGKPIRILVTLANMDGPLPGAFNASILLHDTLDNSHVTPLPWFSYNSSTIADSLEKTTQVSITDGIDTVELYLFAVSLNSDSLHQLRLTVTPQNGSIPLTAQTIPFMLRKDPAKIRQAGAFLPSDHYPIAIRNRAETGVMQLRFNENGRHLITLFSCSGRSVYSETINGPEATIKLRQGVYILQGMREGSRVASRQKLLVR